MVTEKEMSMIGKCLLGFAVVVVGFIFVIAIFASLEEFKETENVSYEKVIVDGMEYKLVPNLTKRIRMNNKMIIFTVGLHITNLGKESKDVSGGMFTLIDSEDRVYELSNSFYTGINPSLSTAKLLKWVVPTKSSGWKLKIISGFWSDKEGTIILSD